MAESDQTSGRDQLSSTYEGYLSSSETRSRWSLDNPGNRFMLEERDRATVELLTEAGVGGRPLRILDLGCGGSTLFPSEFPVAFRMGIDLLEERLPTARESGLLDGVACADGQAMPFPDDRFDLVLLSTVLSSIESHEVRRRITLDAWRVTQPGGGVLLYDMRVQNPRNRAVSPVRESHLADLFPGARIASRSLSLNPVIARHLGDRQWLYRSLAAVPLLRSHLICLAVH